MQDEGDRDTGRQEGQAQGHLHGAGRGIGSGATGSVAAGPANATRRWTAQRDAASLVALGAALVLVVLVGLSAHRVIQLSVWSLFVVDLVVLRLTCRRLRRAVSGGPTGRTEGLPVPSTVLYGA